MSKKKIAKKVYKNEMVNEQANSWTTEEKLRVVVAATGITDRVGCVSSQRRASRGSVPTLTLKKINSFHIS